MISTSAGVWRGQDSSWHTPTFSSRQACQQWMRSNNAPSNPLYPNLNHLISLCVGTRQLHDRLFARQVLLNRLPARHITPSELIFNRFFVLRTTHVNTGCEGVLALSQHALPAPNEIQKEGTEATPAPPQARGVSNSRVYDTAMYLYNEMRCGVFVKIVDQKVVMFTPFVNPEYTNRWVSLSQSSVEEYYAKKARLCKRPVTRIHLPVNKWWANSYVVCNEPTVDVWGGSNLPQLRHMLESVCLFREVPDVEFFLNKRDIPQIRLDGTHPQSFMFPVGETPVVSPFDGVVMLPVASGYVSDRFRDVAFPLPVDWERACVGQLFPPDASGADIMPQLPWELRMSRACFRGSCTGGGTTRETNQRLNLVLLAHEWRNGLLDAALTGWNLRDKKSAPDSALGYIVPSDFPSITAGRHNYMPMAQQCHFKYVVYVDGHSAANRYGALMEAEFVILRVRSVSRLANELWIYPFLEDGVDHISIAADLSDLKSKLEWCVSNDVVCRQIAHEARLKWEKYMQKEGILDFVQLALYDMSTGLVDGLTASTVFWPNVVARRDMLPPPCVL